MSVTETTAADSLYTTIKQRILSGDIVGGRMLSEGELAAEYGVSRTPVREAFLRLQGEGWMRLYPKRGALVVEAPADEIALVLEARRLLEVHAIAVVVDSERASDDLHERLGALLARQRSAADAGDVVEFSADDAEFHNLIMRAGGNRLLSGFAEILRDRQQRMTADTVRTSESMHRVVAEHELLLAALAARDADAFAAELDEHFHSTHGIPLPSASPATAGRKTPDDESTTR